MIEPLENTISQLKRLPGVGRKTAERLVFYLLTRDDREVKQIAQSLVDLTQKVKRCNQCYNFSQSELCNVCTDRNRDRSKICVVNRPWDVAKIESTNKYNGLYHVLGGLINPIEDVAPQDLTIGKLVNRVKDENVKEVIIALEPKTEGESTAMYVAKQLRPLNVDMTQIAQGVPVGRDLEFTDKATLTKAFEGRRKLE